ncbi:MAG: endonuclease domain-containing protein [Clostridia bacterium]|nr:endonuclease domain-containing protein [Clostridia bacterium]
MKEYNKSNIELAKVLRKNMTKHEKKLWYDFLRNYPIRFQRQKAIGNYIADFYCAKAKLIIELDGSGHYTEMQILKDNDRTYELEKMYLSVLRIPNTEVFKNFSGVCRYIDSIVQESLPPSTTLPPPSSDGGCEQKKF